MRLTYEQIEEMPAGRGMDALVAEYALGFLSVGPGLFSTANHMVFAASGGFFAPPLPAYSTDIAAAWDVVDKLRRDDFELRYREDYWAAEFGIHYGYGETAPLAICRAALMQVVDKIENEDLANPDDAEQN